MGSVTLELFLRNFHFAGWTPNWEMHMHSYLEQTLHYRDAGYLSHKKKELGILMTNPVLRRRGQIDSLEMVMT